VKNHYIIAIMNSKLPNYFKPERHLRTEWVSAEVELGGTREVFKSPHEFFVFVAVGAQINSLDCGAILDGKNIPELLSELTSYRIKYAPDKSHARIFCVDDAGKLVCIETGSGSSAITCNQVTEVARRPKDLFSPKASEYLENHPDILVEPTPEAAIESSGRVKGVASMLFENLRKLFGKNRS